MKTRLDIAGRMAARETSQEPLDLLDAAFGPLASRDTRDTITRAESRRQGIALLLMSPEFQRR
jgi:uncharacterized protein (DUF1800 family)